VETVGVFPSPETSSSASRSSPESAAFPLCSPLSGSGPHLAGAARGRDGLAGRARAVGRACSRAGPVENEIFFSFLFIFATEF
jgi:hypothetical protein